MNPAFHFVVKGKFKLKAGDFVSAIEYFSQALAVPTDNSLSAQELTINALLWRAQCFFNLGLLDDSLRDSTEASILSNDINNQNGICGALHLMTTTHEKFGDVRGAFQLAVSLKIVDFKAARAHIRRLREKLERIFREDATLVDKLRDNLMSKGIDYFTKEQFEEAAEFFTEVVRLVCQFQFVPQAHLYKAQCHLKLDEYEEARESCMAVLERDPDNKEAKNILEGVNAMITKKEGKKKRPKKENEEKDIQLSSPYRTSYLR